MPTATSGDATIDVAADPDVVYAVLSDVSRMGERSPECYRCEWLDGVTAPQVGARFRGHNRLGVLRWSTTCVVTVAEPGREFAFTVLSGGGREETKWRYLIRATESGCRVTESYEFLWCPTLARIAEIPFPRDKQLRRGIQRTLCAIKNAAEAATGSRPTDACEPEAAGA